MTYLSDLILDYEQWVKTNYPAKTKTLDAHFRIIAKLIDFLSENKIELSNITKETIEQWLNQIGKSILTKESYFQNLKRFILYLKNKGIINNLDLREYTIGDFKIKDCEAPISKEQLLKEIKNGCTNKQISIKYKIGIPSIQTMKRFYNIDNPPKLKMHSRDESIKSLLHNRGMDVVIKKNERYKYLINGHIRADIFLSHSLRDRNFFQFTLTTTRETKHLDGENFEVVGNHKIKKKFFKTCDFIICIGLNDKKYYSWIIPSTEITKEQKVISLGVHWSDSKLDKYKEAWNLLIRD